MPQKWKPTWQSLRLPTCDYGSPGQYFVTICTRGRARIFGEIVDGAMRLSRQGRIAETAWRNRPTHHRHLALDAFVLMPNHLHGILLFHAPGAALGTVIGGFKSEVSRLLRQPRGNAITTITSSEPGKGLIGSGPTSKETRSVGRR